MYEKYAKRAVDLLLSGVAALALSPVLLITGLAIRVEDGAPVIYRQTRVGREGREFTVLKFRSMPTNTRIAPSSGMASAKVTRVGRVIRRLNADELPQLLNILRGDMSLVGPRPALKSQSTLIEHRVGGPGRGLRRHD
jgi:O-antigen biosynthesis protein WbqP